MTAEVQAKTRRKYRDLLTIALPDTAITLATTLVRSKPESGGPYDQDSEGKKLKTERQKALRYLELAVGDPCFLEWVAQETDRAQDKADELRLNILLGESETAKIRAEERETEIVILREKA